MDESPSYFVLCSSEEDSSSTVEALLFSPAEQNLLITGSLEGIINVWDLSSQVSKVLGRSTIPSHLGLGWVDIDFDSSTLCQVLLWLIGNWLNWQSRWWNVRPPGIV